MNATQKLFSKDTQYTVNSHTAESFLSIFVVNYQNYVFVVALVFMRLFSVQSVQRQIPVRTTQQKNDKKNKILSSFVAIVIIPQLILLLFFFDRS